MGNLYSAHTILEVIFVRIDTNALVAMTEANQNFSRVARLVDEQGAAVILKNNKPRYVVVDFSEYDSFQAYRRSLVDQAADRLIEENLEAFQELSKSVTPQRKPEDS